MSFNPPVHGYQLHRIARRNGEGPAAPQPPRENVTPFADLLANTAKGMPAPRQPSAITVPKRSSRLGGAASNTDAGAAEPCDADSEPGAVVRQKSAASDDQFIAPSIDLFPSVPAPAPERVGIADERSTSENAIDADDRPTEAQRSSGDAGELGSTEAPGATLESKTATRFGDTLQKEAAPQTAERTVTGEAMDSETPQLPAATSMTAPEGQAARDSSARGSPSDCGGIASAQQLSAMKSAAHSNEFAGAGKQNLPDPNPEQHAAPQALLATEGDAALPEGVWMAHPPMESHPSVIMFGEVQRSSPASEAAERLQTSISREVTFMRQMKPDSLAVVLKPDSQTEIFLSLSMTNGELEARARCERGDFQGLNEHWIELQQSLLRQGVKLLPLEDKIRFAHTLSDNTPHADQHARDGNKQREAPAQDEPLPWTGAVTEPLKKPARRRTPAAHRLLESWA